MAEQVSDHSAMRLLFNATSVFDACPKPDLTTTPALPTSKSTCGIIANSKYDHTPNWLTLSLLSISDGPRSVRSLTDSSGTIACLATSLKQAQNNEVSDGSVLPETKVILVTNSSLFPFFFFFSFCQLNLVFPRLVAAES